MADPMKLVRSEMADAVKSMQCEQAECRTP